jgi:hypothetical protein
VATSELPFTLAPFGYWLGSPLRSTSLPLSIHPSTTTTYFYFFFFVFFFLY